MPDPSVPFGWMGGWAEEEGRRKKEEEEGEAKLSKSGVLDDTLTSTRLMCSREWGREGRQCHPHTCKSADSHPPVPKIRGNQPACCPPPAACTRVAAQHAD